MKIFRAAILTAKEVEFDAVRRHLIDERRVDDTFDGTVYRRAKIRRDLESDVAIDHWDIAIYRTGRGQQPTTYGPKSSFNIFALTSFCTLASPEAIRAILSSQLVTSWS